MYAKICGLEVLSSYITELGVGDILSLQAMIKNPLDWNHFYEKIQLINKGSKTDFTVVTNEGDRLVGSGLVEEVEKWSNNGKFGFKIKVRISKQKSLADRRIKLQNLQQKKQGSTILQKRGQSHQTPSPLTQAIQKNTVQTTDHKDVASQVPPQIQ